MKVAFLLIDGFSLLTYASAREPLRAANVLARRELYQIWNIPAQGARATAAGGALVPADAHVGERVDFDLVVVVAERDSLDAQQPRLLDWLRQLARRNVRLGGIGAGPLILARAGLVRDRRVAVHWTYRNALQEMYPEVRLERHRFSIDGDRMSAAGGTASVDMMQSFISQQHGDALAGSVSDWCSHSSVRSADIHQSAAEISRFNTHNAQVLSSIEVMENHLSDPLDLSQVASIVQLSARQLNRLFKDNLQCSTMEFYRRLRLLKGFQLLAQSSMSIGDVVAATGFVSASHFSRSFKQLFGHAPSETRQDQKSLADFHAAYALAGTRSFANMARSASK